MNWDLIKGVYDLFVEMIGWKYVNIKIILTLFIFNTFISYDT